MKVSKPAVSEMLRKLLNDNYIKMAPYSEIMLTQKGIKAAKELTFKHRIIEVFLKDVLKISKNNIHEEAHRLEHAFSNEAIKNLSKFLNNPKYSPEGKIIPKI
jgi:DtxR family Mn-dependent transcriptional regulator